MPGVEVNNKALNPIIWQPYVTYTKGGCISCVAHLKGASYLPLQDTQHDFHVVATELAGVK